MKLKKPLKLNKYYLAQTRFLYHCHIKIKLPVGVNEELINECFSILENIEQKYNSYVPGSYFFQLNENAGRWIQIDETTRYLLEETTEMSRHSCGAFDITVMPLLKLWGFYQKKENKQFPSQEEMEQKLKFVNSEIIELKGNKARLAAGQELVTGSFIKAYAVDQVISFLKARGVKDALINAGGSTIVALNAEENPYWEISIPYPHNTQTELMRLRLSNSCLSLSGRSSHYALINGIQYAHIINARTGHPSANRQAAVLTSEAFAGDLLATTLFALDETDVPLFVSKLSKYGKFQYYLIGENQDCDTVKFIHSKSSNYAANT